KHQKESAKSDRLHCGDLAWDRRSDHRSKRSYAERIDNRCYDERRRITGESKLEICEQQNHHQKTLGRRDRHEREDLAEKKFVSRDARDVDLEYRLLLALARHRERGEKRRKHRHRQHKDSGAVELL